MNLGAILDKTSDNTWVGLTLFGHGAVTPNTANEGIFMDVPRRLDYPYPERLPPSWWINNRGTDNLHRLPLVDVEDITPSTVLDVYVRFPAKLGLVVVEYFQEDDKWIAAVGELRAVFAEGETREEAIDRLLEITEETFQFLASRRGDLSDHLLENLAVLENYFAQ